MVCIDLGKHVMVCRDLGKHVMVCRDLGKHVMVYRDLGKHVMVQIGVKSLSLDFEGNNLDCVVALPLPSLQRW